MKQWQFNLGISGSLLWVVVINNLDYVLETGSQSLNDLCTGYILGFITSLVFFLFWERVHGRIELYVIKIFHRLYVFVSQHHGTHRRRDECLFIVELAF